jgi:fructose-bisphosphate aldolase class II
MNNHVLNFTEASRYFTHAKANQYAFPAVNVISTNTINAVLETAREVNSPVIIQLSQGGAAFFAGKSLSNTHQEASTGGAVAAAHYVHEIASLYGVPVFLNTDHAAKKLLPWVDGMILAGDRHYKQHGTPLFTSHMLDLSGEPLKENIEICKRYLDKLTAMDMYLEIELGVTGGEEDGVDNTHVDNAKLYTQPEEVAYAYEALSKISKNFVIAASFGNVHGVYKPGNVKLEPVILKNSQQYVCDTFKTSPNPVSFVFHGGSGSEPEKIKEAISYGVVKMNIDTDIQWAFWKGIHANYIQHESYLQTQLGNREGTDSPNKKYYDPRVWLRQGELSIKDRLTQSFHELNAVNRIQPMHRM